ncbi:MAG: hypothetical protein ACE5I7_00450 [Candidatus Binatia bacterium]
MRRLYGTAMGMRAVILLALMGCGSTSGNRLVLRFLGFDGSGITQADSVRPSSGEVDIMQELCSIDADGNPVFEPFTETTVNGVFRNEQGADIRLERYTVDFGPKSGLPDSLKVFNGVLNGNVQGGRCDTDARPCALDADCSGGATGVTGSCLRSETTINGILLVDFDRKAQILPGTLNLAVTFFGSDVNQSFKTSTSYVVRFDDFDNCPSSGTTAGLP